MKKVQKITGKQAFYRITELILMGKIRPQEIIDLYQISYVEKLLKMDFEKSLYELRNFGIIIPIGKILNWVKPPKRSSANEVIALPAVKGAGKKYGTYTSEVEETIKKDNAVVGINICEIPAMILQSIFFYKEKLDENIAFIFFVKEKNKINEDIIFLLYKTNGKYKLSIRNGYNIKHGEKYYAFC